LPLDLPTEDSTQVLTVIVTSATDEAGELQRWTKSASGWSAVGAPVVAHVGRLGVTAHEREGIAATPIGSFTLTQAFGRLPNPGTALPYFRTTPRDWWISQPGPLYNTHQQCAGECDFAQHSPNTQLMYVDPQYNLGIVIDYNRDPVVQGAGSGVFLHVTRGLPTAGCISIAQPDLVQVMRWLKPSAHPHILVGVARS